MTSDQAYRYFIWSLIGTVFLLSISFFLAFNLVRYSGELHVRAQFYTPGVMDSFQQTDVVPFEVENNKTTMQQLDEMLIRYYLEQRYSSIPDKIEMGRRWYQSGFFASLATGKIYKKFIPDLKQKLSTLPSAVKTVDILSVQQTDQRKDKKGTDIYTYTIDLDVYVRLMNGETGLSQRKRVILRVSHYPRAIRWNKRFNTPYGSMVRTNPYGFVIGDFSETDRK